MIPECLFLCQDRVRSARFEQIWRSRKGSRDADNESLREICHLYDVVRVDVEDEESERVQKQKYVLLSKFLR